MPPRAMANKVHALAEPTLAEVAEKTAAGA